MKFTPFLLVLLLAVTAALASPDPHKFKKGGFGRRGFGYAPVKVIPVHYPVYVGGYGGGYGGGFGGGYGGGFGGGFGGYKGGFGGGFGGLYGGGHYGGYGYGR
nr:keratin-3, type I cytoskeletal 51 kDa-like [Procambarus clarkii]